MFTASTRIVKFAAKDFWRNGWLSLVTTSILALAFVSVNVLLVLNLVARNAVTAVEDRIDVSVYLVKDASDEAVKTMRSYLLALPQVKDVTMTTPDEALASFKARHADNPAIAKSLDALGENPLGPSVSIKARATEDYPSIMAALENPAFSQYVAEKNFDDHKAVIDRVQLIATQVRNAALATSILFLVIAILIVFNSVRIAIYTHREEIAIMKLVGASNGFVRMPFMVQGGFACMLALLVTAAVVVPALRFLTPSVVGFFGSADVDLFGYYRTNALPIFGLQLAGGLILSVAASAIAVGKYLRR